MKKKIGTVQKSGTSVEDCLNKINERLLELVDVGPEAIINVQYAVDPPTKLHGGGKSRVSVTVFYVYDDPESVD